MLDFMMTETRFSQLPKLKGETAYEMFEKTKNDAMRRRPPSEGSCPKKRSNDQLRTAEMLSFFSINACETGKL